MPHLLIEYSGNLISSFDDQDVLADAHHVMLDCGLFEPDAVKSRAHVAAKFLIGNNSEKQHTSFIHARVFLLAGRTVEQKGALSKALFEVLKNRVPNASHVSVDVREMNADTYQKS